MHDHEPPLRLHAPPAYTVRDPEVPQRILGVLLWVALIGLLWAFGAG